MSGAFDAFIPDDSGKPTGESTREGDRAYRTSDAPVPVRSNRAGHVDMADICLEDLQVVAGAVDRWRSLRAPFVVKHHAAR
ncbi:hypothetical protein [Nocardia asteroides]|uniref:hypothetical protein n=1 Tax=Nocardia asteroides TaxID=1824 RepID=UPI00342083C5